MSVFLGRKRVLKVEWKRPLRVLEMNKQWDVAIDFMQQVIKENFEVNLAQD